MEKTKFVSTAILYKLLRLIL